MESTSTSLLSEELSDLIGANSSSTALFSKLSKELGYPDSKTGWDNPTFILYERKDWQALPTSQTPPIVKPVRAVRFTDTGPGIPYCTDHEMCAPIIQQLQQKHIQDLGMVDIQYNFLIGNDGTLFEGRGWHSAPHMTPEEEQIGEYFYHFAYIGDFSRRSPTFHMLTNGYSMMVKGESLKYIVRPPKITNLKTLKKSVENELTLLYKRFEQKHPDL
ncbi:peptidoglycan recognition protein 1-like [Macrosteles quadrilineatus]|uniref:peptidoglycan recognition protein 1-like n=1 Tax=Macrosteles quadrilineatus TaxID=74068 RepID=UPI0023E34F9A|nr:peptidoglycan recognition protein 1-like [Macrosteles quadrilineatus]